MSNGSARSFITTRRIRSTFPALALLILASTKSAVTAFPNRALGIGEKSTLSPLGAKKESLKKASPRRFPRFSNAAAAMSSSIRKRKSEAEEAAKSDALSYDSEEKAAKIAHNALESIRLCSRMALAAFVSDVFVSLMEQGTLFPRTIAWTDAVDIFDSFNILVFAHGLWKVSSIYAANLQSSGPMTPETTVDLCSTMAGLWRNTAIVMVAISMSQASTLTEHLAFVPKAYMLPAGVAVIALVGRLVLGKECADNAAKTIKEEGNSPVKAGYEKGRFMGLVASRNMRFCTGSFGIMAAVQFASWLLKPAEIVERVFSVFDFITPATIAGLLLTLYHGFLRAVIKSTAGKTVKAEGYAEYADLFEAQKGFYNEAGKTLKSQAIFAVLPYAFGMVKPYGLAVFHFVAGKLGLVEMPTAA